MSVTVANALDLPYRIVGAQKETVNNVTFDESYTEKGEALTASQLGLNYIESATCNIKSVAGEVNVAEAFYDPDNAKIHLYNETPAEVASEGNVKEVVVQVTARGH